MSSITDIERRHIRTRLKRIVVDSRALKAAVEDEFGPDFDRVRWAEAFESEAPADVNRVSAVVGAFERIVNGLVEAARSGLVASGGARPGGTPESVRGDLMRIRDDGGLKDAQLDLLVDLSRLRDELQHVYVEVTADMVRDGVRRLRGTLGDLLKSLNTWFARYDVGLS